MEPRLKSEMERELGERLRAGAFHSRAVFLFGHCNATEEMADYLMSNGVMPNAILDNNMSKQGQEYRSIPVVAPDFAVRSPGKDSIVLIANRFYPEMSKQLKALGYGGEIVQVVEYSFFQKAHCVKMHPVTLRKACKGEKSRLRDSEKIIRGCI